MLGARREKFKLITSRVDLGKLPDSMDECDAYLGGGSRYAVFEEKGFAS